jgi:hypothetical protein
LIEKHTLSLDAMLWHHELCLTWTAIRKVSLFATAVETASQPPAQGNWMWEVMFAETFSEALYVDEYELKQGAEFGGPQVSLLREIDLEKPAERSSSNVVWVLGPAMLFYDLSVTVTLPVHLRYNAPSASATHNTAVVLPPQVFVRYKHRCPSVDQKSGPLDSTPTGWQPLPFADTTGTLHVQVPVGSLQDEALVSGGTLLVTVVGALALMLAVPRVAPQ